MGGTQACKQVLVVDDEHDVQEVIAEILADEDYSATPASNGREALEQLLAMDEKPCVILLDLKMPVMNGFQFRAAQQRDPALRAIPVIIVTANFQEAEVADLEAAAFVRKPFNADALLHEVNVACHGGGTFSDATWCRVSGDPERWERTGFGAVEARGSTLWSALPTCGHDYYCGSDMAAAQQQLDQHSGLCFVCWQRIGMFRRALRRGQPTPPGGTSSE
jgi:CheY-like chemotaxis protein